MKAVLSDPLQSLIRTHETSRTLLKNVQAIDRCHPEFVGAWGAFSATRNYLGTYPGDESWTWFVCTDASWPERRGFRNV